MCLIFFVCLGTTLYYTWCGIVLHGITLYYMVKYYCVLLLCITLHSFGAAQAFDQAVGKGEVLVTLKNGIQYAGHRTLYKDKSSSSYNEHQASADLQVDSSRFDELSDLIDEADFEFDTTTPVFVYSEKGDCLTDNVKLQLQKIVKACKGFQDKGLLVLQKLKAVNLESHNELKVSLASLCTHKNQIDHILDFHELACGKSLTPASLDEVTRASGTLMTETSNKMAVAKAHLKNAGITV